MVALASRLSALFHTLDVPTTLLVAIATATVISLAGSHMGEAAVLLGPLVLAYLPCFGVAFVSAVARSRYLPHAEGLSFFIPILCGVFLVFFAGFLGVRAAQLLDQSVFRSQTKVACLMLSYDQPSNQSMKLTAGSSAINF